jgi:hypothetical protein
MQKVFYPLLILFMLVLPATAQAHWPVQPTDQMHGIRGSFGDARYPDYHHGVDIPLNDDRPRRGAPSWASQRVFAVRSGRVWYQLRRPTTPSSSCTENRTAIDQTIYYHVVPTVSEGQYVRAGEPIGWSCRGRWHIHITQGYGPNPVNPLTNGLFKPYWNKIKPTITEFAVYTPCDSRAVVYEGRVVVRQCGRKLNPDNVAGRIDLRFQAYEEQPKVGVFATHPWIYAPLHPYQASVRVTRLIGGEPTGRVFINRRIWQLEHFQSMKPMNVHFAPGFRRWQPMRQCSRHRDYARCQGNYWYRAFATDYINGEYGRYLNTRDMPNGRYRVMVTLRSHTGMIGGRYIDITVNNKPGRSKASGMIEDPDPSLRSRYRPRVWSHDDEGDADVIAYAQALYQE